jgi:hypothetical protein
VKQFTINISSWAIMALFIGAATFSPNGLGVQIAGYEWLASVASFVANLIPVVATIGFITSTFVLVVAILHNNFLAYMVASTIKEKRYDLEQGKRSVRFKPVRFFIAVIYWVFLIGAGWVASGILMILSGIMFQAFGVMQRSSLSQIEEDLPEEDLREFVNGVLRQ